MKKAIYSSVSCFFVAISGMVMELALLRFARYKFLFKEIRASTFKRKLIRDRFVSLSRIKETQNCPGNKQFSVV